MNSITLSWFVRTMRQYMKNPNKSYQMILSEMFGELADDKCYFVESTSSSRIMTCEYDVPKKVRETAINTKKEVLIKMLTRYFENELNYSLENQLRKKVESDVGLSGVSKTFIEQISSIENDYEFFATVLLCAIQTDNRNGYRKTLIKNNKFCLDAFPGDLISLSFNKKLCRSFKITVLPVDDNFVMETSYNTNESPLIARDSLHGQFIIRMNKMGLSDFDIKKKITYIKGSNGHVIGKILNCQTEFWLVPISHLGLRNRAESSVGLIEKALDAVIEEYDMVGQGTPLFIPLLGTGRSRVFATNKDALDFICNKVKQKSDFLNGTIHIVLYKKEIWE